MTHRAESWSNADGTYEMVGRAWAELASVGNEDSVFVELIDGEIQITVLADRQSTAVKLPPEEVKTLRNALNRALARVS